MTWIEDRYMVGVRARRFCHADLDRWENRLGNPTVEQAAELCSLTGKGIYDLFQPAELDYTALDKRPARQRKAGNPRIAHRVTPERYAEISAAVLAAGYADVGDWMEHCIRTLLRRAKRKAPAGAGTTGKGE